MSDWIKIATDIELNYHGYDGFVVLHGTDTMAYTASALSFLLEDLGKPIVLTGSQIPLSEMLNDAVENLLGAIILAGHVAIPEVGIYFCHRLLRGNRTTKADARAFDAFESPNVKPLVRVGVDMEVNWPLVLRPSRLAALQAHKCLSRNVGVLRLFPSITVATIRAFLSDPMYVDVVIVIW